MGLSAQHPAIRAKSTVADFGVYSLDSIEVDRASNLNVTCRIPESLTSPLWYRVPPLLPDQVPRGYRFARGDDAEESPHGAWAIPNCHAFSLPRLALAGLGSDHGWRADSHPRFLGNLTGHGSRDIVGFGNDGVWVRWATDQGGLVRRRWPFRRAHRVMVVGRSSGIHACSPT